MKFLKIVSGMAMVAAMAACGSDSGTTTTPDAPPVAPDAKPGFPQPAGTVAVNFSVDDTANKAFAATQSDGASDLWWKGAIAYDPATRKVTYDSTAWSGTATANMWARLYDDGPWTTGGHEPMGAVAGDHKWGITVFATPPATAMQAYDYGLTDGSYEKSYGNGWMWPSGPNGTFTVHAGDTAAITAPGLTIPAFGTTDMQIVIDTTNLAAGTAWDTTQTGIKGSAWAWGTVSLTVASGKATFTLSAVVGAGHPFNHTGLLHSGDKPQFVITFAGVEYKDATGFSIQGVTAGTKAQGASTFTPATIALSPTGDPNPFITVP